MKNSKIAGIGHYVPERVVTNNELTQLMETSDEWIQERTGIKERHYAKNTRKLLPQWEQKLPELLVKGQEFCLLTWILLFLLR